MSDQATNEKTQCTALDRIDFHGVAIEATRQGDDVWVGVKRVCEALGVSRQGQQAKLTEKPWATGKMILLVADDGKPRSQFCLHLDSLPMWLATIEPSRVKEEVRTLLATFQKECARVLRDHFFPHRAPADSAPLDLQAVIHGQAAILQSMAEDRRVLVETFRTIAQMVTHPTAAPPTTASPKPGTTVQTTTTVKVLTKKGYTERLGNRPGRKSRPIEERQRLSMNLILVREHFHLSQNKLAAMLDISPCNYGDWERMQNFPAEQNLQRLAKLFSCEPSDFLADRPPLHRMRLCSVRLGPGGEIVN